MVVAGSRGGCAVRLGRWRPWNVGKIVRAAKSCLACGKMIENIPSVVRKRKFCCQTCSGRHYAKSTHPGFRPDLVRRRGWPKALNEWRVAVLTRDEGVCRWCLHEGIVTRRCLQVHHLIPVAEAPEKVIDTNNGITLCVTHHHNIGCREAEYFDFLRSLLQTAIDWPIPRQRRFVKIGHISLEELRHRYWDEGLSTVEMGARYGCTASAVQQRFKRAGVPMRGLKEAAFLRLSKTVRKPKVRRSRAMYTPEERRVRLAEVARSQWADPIHRAKITRGHAAYWTAERRLAQAERARTQRRTHHVDR